VIAEQPGIQRQTRVDMLLAEVGVAVGILLDSLLGRGSTAASGPLRPFGFLSRNQSADGDEAKYQADGKR